ncbi:hypothetical protein HDU83_007228 [Entophlyctis luteolus]|nr:hypothetical protein HDU83_007228 [Entophlyctis luteolus]
MVCDVVEGPDPERRTDGHVGLTNLREVCVLTCLLVWLHRVAPKLGGVPFPDMFFGNNSIRLRNHTADFEFTVDAISAIGTVQVGEADFVKVSYSKEWTEKRLEYHEKAHGKISKIPKPYDWTYTPQKYNGTTTANFTKTKSKLDMELLKRNEPILWYDEVVLYEDELSDNGSCLLNARVVSSGTSAHDICFLLLLRFFLRIDNVLFRIHDTRVFHSFDSRVVLREISTRECSYERVLSRLRPSWPTFAGSGDAAGARDLSALGKADWVASGMVDPWEVDESDGNEATVVDGVSVFVRRDELSF